MFPQRMKWLLLAALALLPVGVTLAQSAMLAGPVGFSLRWFGRGGDPQWAYLLSSGIVTDSFPVNACGDFHALVMDDGNERIAVLRDTVDVPIILHPKLVPGAQAGRFVLLDWDVPCPEDSMLVDWDTIWVEKETTLVLPKHDWLSFGFGSSGRYFWYSTTLPDTTLFDTASKCDVVDLSSGASITFDTTLAMWQTLDCSYWLPQVGLLCYCDCPPCTMRVTDRQGRILTSRIACYNSIGLVDSNSLISEFSHEDITTGDCDPLYLMVYQIPSLERIAKWKVESNWRIDYTLKGQGIFLVFSDSSGWIFNPITKMINDIPVPHDTAGFMGIVEDRPEGFGIVWNNGELWLYNREGKVLKRTSIGFPEEIAEVAYQSGALIQFGQFRQPIVIGFATSNVVGLLPCIEAYIGSNLFRGSLFILVGDTVLATLNPNNCNMNTLSPLTAETMISLSPDNTRLAIKDADKIEIYRIRYR